MTEPALDAVIIGLGESGYASACHLAGLGQQVAVLDTRAVPPMAKVLAEQHPEIEWVSTHTFEPWLLRAREIVLSPGVDPRMPAIRAARERGQSVIGEIELFARAVQAPVWAITGSNGKSTVTRMLAAMAKASGVNAPAGGNLSPAALTLLSEKPRADAYILELSSFQLETTQSLKPAVACVLNLSPDHLDRYTGMVDYGAAKARILNGATHAVLNMDDAAVRTMQRAEQTLHGFSVSGDTPAQWNIIKHDGEPWFAEHDRALMRCADLPLMGRHNRANALAALAMGQAVGLDESAMLAALRSFEGLAHRAEVIGHQFERLWINDSKATNVASAVAAIGGLEQPLVLIAGGQSKRQQFDALADAMRAQGRAAVLYGEDAEVLAQALGDTLPVKVVADLAAAVKQALALSRRGDAVLLAPACASLDQFRDYRDRGDQFRAEVEALSHE